MPAFVKVATPLDIVLVTVPTLLPPRLTVIVTIVDESVVSVAPVDRSILTTGWVPKAAPLAAVAAEVNKLKPAGVIVCVTLVTPDTA
jgi:hypothetical protein